MSRSYATTGTPFEIAVATDGLIALSSWARIRRTFAPCEIRFSTFVAWVSADDFASFATYLPPAASTAFLIAGSSHLAQRSSW